MMEHTTTGVYMHIPYCTSKCHYCDFYSLPFSPIGATAYVEALIHQFDAFDRGGYVKMIDTIYIGGGTPSLLPAEMVGRMLDRIFKSGRVCDDAEISMEINPETVHEEYFREIQALGINRISVGIQSSFDETLKAIGRRNNFAQAQNAVEAACRAGFDNISADIMIGLPNESRQHLEQTIHDVMQLPIVHVSAYMLKLMEGTPFGDHPPTGLADDDEQAEYYEMACRMLEQKGLMQYEISNFAKYGYQSRHNTRYWDCLDYLGLGAAAHSSINGVRYSFARDVDSFIRVYGNDVGSADPFVHLNRQGEVDANDYIMLQLRLKKGLSFHELLKRFGIKLSPRQMEKVALYAKKTWMKCDAWGIRLTHKGMLVSNAVLSDLLFD